MHVRGEHLKQPQQVQTNQTVYESCNVDNIRALLSPVL